jgi:hypothetical protein
MEEEDIFDKIEAGGHEIYRLLCEKGISLDDRVVFALIDDAIKDNSGIYLVGIDSKEESYPTLLRGPVPGTVVPVPCLIEQTFRIYQKYGRRPGFFPCSSCNENVYKMQEYYYRLGDDVWEACGVGELLLCIGCVEAKLGRRLTPLDFNPFHTFQTAKVPRSARLRDRMG